MGFEPTVGYKPTPIFKTGAINQLDHLSLYGQHTYINTSMLQMSSKIKEKLNFSIFLLSFFIFINYFIFTSLFPSIILPILYAVSPFSFNISIALSASLPSTIKAIPIPILNVLYISLSGIFPFS